MKVKTSNLHGFRPVTVELTFESMSELKTMYNQLGSELDNCNFPMEECEVSTASITTIRAVFSQILWDLNA
jgi:hypothetical protein